MLFNLYIKQAKNHLFSLLLDIKIQLLIAVASRPFALFSRAAYSPDIQSSKGNMKSYYGFND